MNMMPPFLPIVDYPQFTNLPSDEMISQPAESLTQRETKISDTCKELDGEDEDEESEIEYDGNYIVNDEDNCWSAVNGRSFKRQRRKLKVGILGEIKKKPKKPDNYQGISSSMCIDGGFGLMTPKVSKGSSKVEYEPVVDNNTWINCLITDETIRANRLSTNEMINTVPAYTNYSPGLPSCRLYLKNLSKKVTDYQLKCIYGRYVNLDNESECNMFHVQLFKTGRFRNQAFISLPNQESASLALNETNGYLIEGKPLIVSFSRSTKSTDSN
ncbi:RNA-binding region-containing protein 3-like [Panonychus citri]|uniref:RNA-binding region-containing protein 3-like n=1 Tax=Panonychus citri TaxID=50023 RepID=UPI0023075A76|nr:RNA-binding region-containing protein 3-like [Panonychus citri]